MEKFKGKGALVMALLLTLSSTACGRNAIDYRIGNEDDTENTSANTDSNAEESNNDAKPLFTDVERWEDEFDVKSEKTSVSHIEIFADLDIPDTDRLSVVSVKKIEFDKEYKKELATKIYGSGDIYATEILTRKDYEELIAGEEAYIEQAQKSEGELLEYGLPDESIDEYMQGFDSSIAGARERIKEYQKMMETSPDEYPKTEDFHEDEYIGEIDGINYKLGFYDFGEVMMNEESSAAYALQMGTEDRSILIQVENMTDICPEEMKDSETCFYISDGNYDAENQCTISEEDALKIAEQFLSGLGYSDLSYSETYPLTFFALIDDRETYINDGYSFTFTRKVNGVDAATLEDPGEGYFVSTVGPDGSVTTMNGIATDIDSGIRVDINDFGIIGFSYKNPLEETTVTEDVTILPIDNIQGIMKDILIQDADSVIESESVHSNYSGYTFDDMRLMYFRIRNTSKDGEYSYIPVWQLSRKTNAEKESLLMINAIDGSRIDLYYEMTGQKQ